VTGTGLSEGKFVHIESDGLTFNTLVTIDGVPVDGVKAVTWRAALGPDGEQAACTATLELEAVSVKVDGKLVS
jgi:hypothetical protein